MRNRFIGVAGLTLGVLLLVSSSVKADNYETNFSLPDDAKVGVMHTDPTNPTGPAVPTSPQQTWAVPFQVTDTTTNGTPFTGFCIDLYHNVSNGQTTTSNPGWVNVAGAQGFGATTAGTTGTPVPNYSGYTTDFGSKLNYLGYVFGQLQAAHSGDTYLLGAVQLAVWTLLDVKFSASGEKAGMASDLTAIMTLIGGTGANGAAATQFYTDNGTSAGASLMLTGGSAIAAYSTTASGHYSSYGGQVLVVHSNFNDGGGDTIQNIVTWGHGFPTPPLSSPEPSSFALAGLGGLGFLAYGWKRRKRA